jgi:DNA-binding transcriptional LysR family regulator
MNSANLDLNLLAVFDAVWRERSVSRAAAALGLPQPTASNALARLRRALGDPLFVRRGGGVVPTARAERLAASVGPGLAAIARSLAGGGTEGFDPLRSDRRFTLIMTDIAEAVILPPLLEACRAAAPNLGFRTLQLGARETRQALESGAVDLAVGYMPDLAAGIRQQRLFETAYACIVSARRKAHGGGMTRAAFLAARHAVAEAAGTGHHVVERALARAGLAPRIFVRVPNFLALPMIVAATDMVATVPRLLGHILSRSAALRVLDHPLDLPRLDIRQFWDERFDADPGNRWLRATLRGVFARIDWGD